MKWKGRLLYLVLFTLLLALIACGGSNQQKMTMANQNPQGSSTDMHKQHNSLAENFSHKYQQFRKGFILSVSPSVGLFNP